MRLTFVALMRHLAGMSRTIDQFERDCAASGLSPVVVLKAAGLNSSTWFRWKAGKVSPTLRSFEGAQEALAKLAAANDASPQSEAA